MCIRDRNKAKQIITSLNWILWSTEIGKEWKKRIYDTMIKSTLIYGSETWRIKEQVKRKLEATEMGALSRAARTSRVERIRNETIKEKIGVQKTIIDCIEEKQVIW